MLTEIEERTVAILKEKLDRPRQVRVGEVHKPVTPTALFSPEIDVILGGGRFEQTDQDDSGFTLKASLYVVVSFKNLRSDKDRRKGIYPIVLACLGWLTWEDLDLDINPLKPVRLDNTTEEAEAKEGKVVFQLEFETGFALDKLSNEDIEEFMEIALEYYLMPGDDEKDAEDIVPVCNP